MAEPNQDNTNQNAPVAPSSGGVPTQAQTSGDPKRVEKEARQAEKEQREAARDAEKQAKENAKAARKASGVKEGDFVKYNGRTLNGEDAELIGEVVGVGDNGIEVVQPDGSAKLFDTDAVEKQ